MTNLIKTQSQTVSL